MTDPTNVVSAFAEARRRLPTRLQPAAAWTMSRWPGRVLVRTAAAVVRAELFDRSMTIAAQLFTSIFPLLILAAVGLGRRKGDWIADAIDMPQASRRVLDEALANRGVSSFGVLGSVIVLISATSLARAIARSYGTIWALPRLRSRLTASWRALAAVMVLAALMVAIRLLIWLTSRSPLPNLATAALTLGADAFTSILIPWILLARRVAARLLVPGGVVFGLAMVAVRPVGSVYLPHALQVSADRYGTIGVAFTYIGWLYVLSFCLLAAAIVGRVIAEDEGRVGRLIRGR